MDAGKTIAIAALDPQRQGTLEFRSYAEKLSARFQMVGYRIVPITPGMPPNYMAVLNYGIDDGTQVITTSSSPIRGDRDDPNKVTGYDTNTSTDVVYRRVVILEIYDFAKYRPNEEGAVAAAQVYSARLISDGGCASLAGVIDEMFNALFTDFPGESGRPRTVETRPDSYFNNC